MATGGTGAARGRSDGEGGPFANRDFVRLFGAQATSLVGSGVTTAALSAFAYELAGSNTTVVVGTRRTLPPYRPPTSCSGAAEVGIVHHLRPSGADVHL